MTTPINKKHVSAQLQWWQRLLCRWLCPRWFEDMPLDKSGEWVACSIKVTPLGQFEVETRQVTGLRNAYEVARWLALCLDWKLHPSLGVKWGVREVKQ